MANAIDKRLPDRFWVKTKIEDTGYETPCRTWIATRTAAGYGRFGWQGKSDFAHRVAYRVLVGPIPEGLELDHLCRNRACVNVDHLEPVTHRENVRRGTAPAAERARQTHCKRGHEFTEENTRIGRKGSRNCLACLAITKAAWNATRRQRRAAAPKVRSFRGGGRKAGPPRTHCPSGHLLAEVGVFEDKNGRRYCRECWRIRGRGAYRARKDAGKVRAKGENMTYYEVKPGQVWADNDKRCAGRTLRIDAIENDKALCTVLTNPDNVQRDLEGPTASWRKDMRGRQTRISLARFKPTNTGYRLIREEQYGVRWGEGLPVFAFGSREEAETALSEDGRGVGVLVVHEYEPGTPNATDWREVDA